MASRSSDSPPGNRPSQVRRSFLDFSLRPWTNPDSHSHTLAAFSRLRRCRARGTSLGACRAAGTCLQRGEPSPKPSLDVWVALQRGSLTLLSVSVTLHERELYKRARERCACERRLHLADATARVRVASRSAHAPPTHSHASPTARSTLSHPPRQDVAPPTVQAGERALLSLLITRSTSDTRLLTNRWLWTGRGQPPGVRHYPGVDHDQGAPLSLPSRALLLVLPR